MSEPDYTVVKTSIPTREHPVNNLAVAAMQEALSPLGRVILSEYLLFKHIRRMVPYARTKVVPK